MNLKIYADGAEINEMMNAYTSKTVSGFTTNPTLMKKSGITDYMAFAKEALMNITDMPISFEVFSDELDEMGAAGLQAERFRRQCLRKNTSNKYESCSNI